LQRKTTAFATPNNFARFLHVLLLQKKKYFVAVFTHCFSF
jgi:hypothetical protein